MTDTVIAIDPGREKCGIAVFSKRDGLLWKQVVETAGLTAMVAEQAGRRGITTVIIGDRTSSHSAIEMLAAIMVGGRPLSVHPVDEHHSSEAARSRYWQENPPCGILRLIPVTMRTPPVPVDDYVAVILAERYFAQKC